MAESFCELIYQSNQAEQEIDVVFSPANVTESGTQQISTMIVIPKDRLEDQSN